MVLNLVVPYAKKTKGSFRADRIEPFRQTSAAYRRGLPNIGVQFTSKADREGLCEISEPIQTA